MVSILQVRSGIRVADDQNDDLIFVQLHSWF